MLRIMKLALIAALVFGSPGAIGQSTLGAILDAGARKLTVDEFKTELLQRSLVGPTGSSMNIEVIYTSAGTIVGNGTGQFAGPGPTVNGTWMSDSDDRICASMRFSGRLELVLARCQYWFKLGETYFLSDSDSDRYAKVLPRKIK